MFINTNRSQYKHSDLSGKSNSATTIIRDNLDKLNNCKTCSELHQVCTDLFRENNLNTQWTRSFLYKLSNIPDHKFTTGLQFCYNAMLSGMNLKVY